MTVHLITAYREIDDLLLECLVNWAEVAEQVRGSFTEPEVHIEFAQRSIYLVEARASVEAALRALDGVNDQIASEAGVSIQVSDTANGRSQDHGQCGCVDPGFPVGAGHSLPADVSSSRPDRPQRPQEHCRGQIRDWNRDILACRHQKFGGLETPIGPIQRQDARVHSGLRQSASRWFPDGRTVSHHHPNGNNKRQSRAMR
jgi:hypothetical protein